MTFVLPNSMRDHVAAVVVMVSQQVVLVAIKVMYYAQMVLQPLVVAIFH
jgi:hypothetical protein